MLRQLMLVLIVLSLFVIPAFAQKTDAEKKEELRAQAVEFLKETSNEIGILRTAENRISFNAELAALMWLHDEKQARAMFGIVITDFRQMLVGLDGQLNVQDFNEQDNYRGSPFSRANGTKAKLLQKLRKAMSVRQQIASAIAENDAVLAYEFFDETARVISNPKLREQYLAQDAYFEARLLQQIAEQDPDKLLAFARKTLQKGVNYSTLGLLQKIYAKNDKEGAAFGEEIFAKIKQDRNNESSNFVSQLNQILSIGSSNQPEAGKTPLFSQQVLREAADLLGQELLKREDLGESGEYGYLENIEKYAPGRAAQIRQKFKLQNTKTAGTGSGSGGAIADSPDSPFPPRPKAPSVAGAGDDEDLPGGLEIPDGKKLSDEEKQKLVNQARQQIAKIDDPLAKITMISLFASQLAALGEKDTALQFMREAESYGTQYPKNYLDYIQNWMLASGYAQIEPNKAFPILEDSIYRINETIGAAIKIGEFVDVNGDFIEEGEVQVGVFGGGLTRELLNGLGQTNNTIGQLAKADFTRTKNLASRFERNEIRILARMLILRAVFSDEQKKGGGETFIVTPEVMAPQPDRP